MEQNSKTNPDNVKFSWRIKKLGPCVEGLNCMRYIGWICKRRRKINCC